MNLYVLENIKLIQMAYILFLYVPFIFFKLKLKVIKRIILFDKQFRSLKGCSQCKQKIVYSEQTQFKETNIIAAFMV